MNERAPTHATDRRRVHVPPVPVVLSEREPSLVTVEDGSRMAVPAGWSLAQSWGWLRLECDGQWVETVPAHAQPLEGWVVQTSTGQECRGATLGEAVMRAMGADDGEE